MTDRHGAARLGPGSRARAAGLAGAALLLLSACGGPGGPFGAQRPAPPRIAPLPIPSVAAVPVGAGSQVARASYRYSGTALLPDRSVTPGVAFADATKAAVCDAHYTLGVRQPRFNDKVVAFANYGVSIHLRDRYQVDHLIPVSLGGRNVVGNLWPQPLGAHAAEEKDALEAQLRRLVCAGAVPLATAQRAIATDWVAAAGTYLRAPTAGAPATPRPTTSPRDPFEVTNGGACPKAGVVGLTTGKRIRFTCRRSGDGSLRWAKRY